MAVIEADFGRPSGRLGAWLRAQARTYPGHGELRVLGPIVRRPDGRALPVRSTPLLLAYTRLPHG